MRRFVFLAVCLAALAVPVVVLAGVGSMGFDGVVDSIESEYHVQATRIPFMSLVSFVANRASHGAAANLHVAEFDNFSAPVDGDELTKMVEAKLGSEWQRVVRETSRKGGEQSLIFMRPEGNRMGLFIVDKDSNELDVVQVSVDPDHFDKEVSRYTHHDRQDGESD
jgi:hypothetical protein